MLQKKVHQGTNSLQKKVSDSHNSNQFVQKSTKGNKLKPKVLKLCARRGCGNDVCFRVIRVLHTMYLRARVRARSQRFI